MLLSLNIENIAVIERASIDFGPGFCVLTGETGAGKSILIDSINAVLGQRTSRELIRSGCDRASVSALFSDCRPHVLDSLAELGYEADEDGSVLILRTLTADGKNICRINGRPATVSILRAVTRNLVNIHGQHDSHQLLSYENHRSYLDHMAGNDDLLASCRAVFDTYIRLNAQLQDSQMDESEKARQIDLLTYQINELEAANLRPGEQQELNQQRTRYMNAEKIAALLSQVHQLLEGDDSVSGAISQASQAVRALEDCSRYVQGLQTQTDPLSEAVYLLEGVAAEAASLAQELDYNAGDLNDIEQRLDTLYRLSQKYGETEQDMQRFLDDARQNLLDIALSDEHITKLRKEVTQARAKAESVAGEITAARRKAAKVFSERVCEELAFLNMPQVKFEVDITACDLSVSGADRVEFLISANPGEPPRPLAQIASGGELSRIMLSIKNVLADSDDIDTMIFDEVDAGVSGQAALRVGTKLRQTAAGRQIICVTHLAQIAAQADEHYLIEKNVRDGRTFTQVNQLNREGRRQELARIIGGAVITETTLRSAQEMLDMIDRDEK